MPKLGTLIRPESLGFSADLDELINKALDKDPELTPLEVIGVLNFHAARFTGAFVQRFDQLRMENEK